MNARVAEIQRQITALSAELVAELADAEAPPEGQTKAPPWLSIEGFAARLGISPRTVYRLLDEGLPHERVRRRIVRIPVERAEAWIARQSAERASALDAAGGSVR